jgi:hypothetical protein
MAQASENGSVSVAATADTIKNEVFVASVDVCNWDGVPPATYNTYIRIYGTQYDGKNFPEQSSLHTVIHRLSTGQVSQNCTGVSNIPGGHYTVELWGVDPTSHNGFKVASIPWASTKKVGNQSGIFRATTFDVHGSGKSNHSYTLEKDVAPISR